MYILYYIIFVPQLPSTHYYYYIYTADTAKGDVRRGEEDRLGGAKGMSRRERKRYILVYINTSSILLVIAGLRSRRRHYHHISGNVEICLYVFGGKNNVDCDGALGGRGWAKKS